MASQWIPISLCQSALPEVFSGNVECHYNYLDQHLKFKGAFCQNIKFQTIKIKYYKQWVRCKYNLESSKEATHLIINAWLSTLDRQVFEDEYFCEIKAIKTIFQPQNVTAGFVFNIPYFETKTVMKFCSLPQYIPERTITDVFNKNFKEDSLFGSYLARLLCSNLNEYYTMSREQRACHSNQLIEMFHKALNIEDHAEKELRHCELDGVHVKFDSCQDYKFIYCLWSDSEILQEDPSAFSVCLIPMHFYSKRYTAPKHMVSGKITKYEDNFVYFERNKKVHNFHKPESKDTVYHVQFIPNRKSIRAAHLALETIENLPFFLSFTNVCLPPGAVFPESSFNWINKNVASNKEQKQAIVNIVNCSSLRAPYIIFGPPGTGKTSTLVEAVAQILKMKPESKILITAQSNSACDEIGVRLLNSVSRTKIYRYFSPSTKGKEIAKHLKSISNFHTGKYLVPSYEEFYHFNVVIVTLVSSSCFVQKIKDKHHFDYIFIDECAASIEPESLIPIAGFGVVNGKLSSQIVLIGDHKQLGAITQSEYASNLCLKVSLMERMMHMEQYSNNDPKYVTQLLDNFRSHPEILKYSNDHFYDGKLRAKVPTEISNFALNWKFLPNKIFPIILHSSLSPCEKKKGGTSWFNMGEIKVIKTYVDILLKNGINGKKVNENDIGVISFYKAQEDNLKNALWATPFIEIGTAEYYQGREKPIMIITTVKSDNFVGFLKHEKRINVGLTRAKSLMILVCNPETLQKDPLWYNFVKYCYINKACAGQQFQMHIKSPQQIAQEKYAREAIERARLQQLQLVHEEKLRKEQQIIRQRMQLEAVKLKKEQEIRRHKPVQYHEFFKYLFIRVVLCIGLYNIYRAANP